MPANPTMEEIKLARTRAGLSQQAAADLIYTPLRTWQDWEYSHSPMHPALFELFVLKARKLVNKRKREETIT